MKLCQCRVDYIKKLKNALLENNNYSNVSVSKALDVLLTNPCTCQEKKEDLQSAVDLVNANLKGVVYSKVNNRFELRREEPEQECDHIVAILSSGMDSVDVEHKSGLIKTHDPYFIPKLCPECGKKLNLS